MDNTSLAARNLEIKSVVVRWPGDFWEQAKIQATKRRTSLQAIITEAVANHLGIDPPPGPVDETAEPAA